jgi:DNA-binding XRE family transcriptional regulator
VKLKDWRGTRSQMAAAKLLKISQTSLSRLERGECYPSLPVALRIEKITNGAVTAASWVQR